MRIIFIIILSIYFIFQSFSQESLPNIQGQILWLKADSILMNNDSTVYEWKDLSSMSTSVFQPNSTNQPKYTDSILNNNPVIRFNGNQWFNGGDICDISDNGITIFIVGKSINSSSSFIAKSVAAGYTKRYAAVYNNEYRYLFHSSTLTNILVPSPPIDSFLIYTNMTNFSILKNKVFMNGLIKDSVNIANYNMNSNYDFLVGAYNNNQGTVPPYSSLNLHGDIAEIIIYDRPLSFEERYHIENYLRFRYFPDTYQTEINLPDSLLIPYGFCDTTIDAGARFTNFLWNTGDTTQTITVNQSGQYSVTVTDIFGFQSEDSIMVYYNEPDIINDTTICLGDSILWNTNLNHDYNFLWSTLSNDSVLAIHDAGSYFVQITDSFGCSFYSDTIVVSVDSFPQNASLGADTTLCAGNSISLVEGNGESFLWSTGDTTNSITINNNGQYWLIATDSTGCVAYDTINITIQGLAPVPAFSYNTTCLGDSTFFTDSSYVNDNSNIIAWQWDFGNSGTSTNQNPATLFLSDSIYTVQLSVETDSGCYNTITQDIKIHSLPVASVALPNLCSNTNLVFTDSSYSGDGNIVDWYWDFGNTDSSILSNPVYSYNNAGTYIISLTVKTEYGCTMSDTQEVEIKESPVAKFSYTNSCIGKTVYFTDNSVYNISHPVINWYWNFGNGQYSYDANPHTVYNSENIYQVEFVIQSLNSCSDTIIKDISVHPVPVAFFTDSIICAGSQHQFTDSSSISSGAIISWEWNLPSVTFTEQSPVYTFNDTGYTDIQLIVYSDSGCIDTSLKTVLISGLPDADFVINPSYGIPFSQLQFICSNDNDNAEYFWDFGDGNNFTGKNPVHSYSDSGNYNIMLIVTDTLGCIDSSSTKFRILLPNCDIAVLDVKKIVDNNYLSVSTQIANFSNIPVEQINLYMDMGDGYKVKETVDTILYPGNIINYTFSAVFEINPNDIPDVICVNAELSACIDNDTDNNEYCLIDDNSFNIYNIYPNPFTDEVVVELSIPADGDIILKVYNNNGKLTDNYYFYNNDAGFLRFKINTTGYAQGNYTIQLHYSDKTISRTIMKN